MDVWRFLVIGIYCDFLNIEVDYLLYFQKEKKYFDDFRFFVYLFINGWVLQNLVLDYNIYE